MDLLKNGCRRHGILAALVLGVAAIAVLFGFEVLLIRGLGLPGILSATAIRFILGALMILLLLKLEVAEKLGFTGKGLGKSLLLAWPFFLLFSGILALSFISANVSDKGISWSWLLAQIVFMTSVAFFEELVFRAGVVNLVKNGLGASRSSSIKTAVIAGLIFSLAHCLNLIGQADLSYTLTQVISNFGMGLFLSTIYLRTGNLVGPMIFHAVNDIVPAVAVEYLAGSPSASAGAAGGVSPTVLVTFVLYVGLSAFYLRRVGKKQS